MPQEQFDTLTILVIRGNILVFELGEPKEGDGAEPVGEGSP